MFQSCQATTPSSGLQVEITVFDTRKALAKALQQQIPSDNAVSPQCTQEPQVITRRRKYQRRNSATAAMLMTGLGIAHTTRNFSPPPPSLSYNVPLLSPQRDHTIKAPDRTTTCTDTAYTYKNVDKVNTKEDVSGTKRRRYQRRNSATAAMLLAGNILSVTAPVSCAEVEAQQQETDQCSKRQRR